MGFIVLLYKKLRTARYGAFLSFVQGSFLVWFIIIHNFDIVQHRSKFLPELCQILLTQYLPIGSFGRRQGPLAAQLCIITAKQLL